MGVGLLKLKLYVLSSVLLFVCFIIVGCEGSYKFFYEQEEVHEENNSESETVVQDHFKKYIYELMDSDAAEIITYDYQDRSMYIAGLKVFEEFSTEEFGFSNEGSVSISKEENVLRFNMTTSTGTLTGAVDGPYIYFEMKLDTNKIIDKKFEPAPDYIKLGKIEFAKHSGEKIELTDERMVEIGLYFKEFIEKIEENAEL